MSTLSTMRVTEEMNKLIEEIQDLMEKKLGFRPSKKEVVEGALKKYKENLEGGTRE